MTNSAGKKPISTMTLLAILSLSLIVNLPGLAVTPMLSTLSSIFPGTTETEKQLLTVMPNVLIIPFVLLSGKLSLTKHKITTIVCALILFVASGVAYLFAKSMGQLIIISCVLGCAAGLVIPFATGLIADCFTGPERMWVMGFESGTSNMALVGATFAVGWLSKGDWHTPFVVYLIGIVPLAFTYFLRNIPKADLTQPQVADTTKTAASEPASPASASAPAPPTQATKAPAPAPTVQQPHKHIYKGFYINEMLGLLGIYGFITFATMVITYYCPFLLASKHMPDTLTSTITSIFFLFIFLPGFFLANIVKVFKGWTFIIGGFCILAGLAIFAFIHNPLCLCIGGGLAGFGYGICQPLIYDKASRTVDNPVKATLALAIVLTANYVAIAIAPFIVDGFRVIFHTQHSDIFPFYLALAMTLIYVIIAWIRRHSFGFAINKSFYK